MDFQHSQKTKDYIARVEAFMEAHVVPADREVHRWNTDPANLWKIWPGLEALKEKARSEGLWNLFLPEDYRELSPGLTNLEYAPLAELMGRYPWSPEVFNCSAPDTGNMEVLAKYGTLEQQERWLKPLMAGKIRSVYMMTEPRVASSDATNIATEIRSDGGDYVINGRKWWSSGMMDPRAELLIVMGRTDPDSPRHRQQSMVIVPRDTPGVELLRPLTVFGDVDSPHGHAEVDLIDVRVPKENIILGEGRGFEIAQGRLGPGRIHHCMRSIGQAQRALELMCQRSTERSTFGKVFAERSYIRQEIAKSYCEIQQARLMTLQAADAIDRLGARGAMDLIAAIKIVAPQMAQNVADRAIQIYGGMGVCDDVPLAQFMAINRTLRLADGPDEVHRSQLGKLLIGQYAKPAADA